MATNPNTVNAADSDRPDPVAANYGQIVGGAIFLGVLLAAVAVISFFWLYRSRGYNALPYVIWAALLGVLFVIVGLLGSTWRGTGRWTEGERGRAILLYLIGAAGLATAVLGLSIPFAYSDVFSKELKVWREHMGTVLLCGAVLFGGLLVMFAGLQVSRGFGVNFPNLRRTVFGYNAVLGTALLVCILFLVNLLPYVKLAPFKYFNETYDWTAQRLYSLAPESKNILTSLSEPVKVYVILFNRDWLLNEEVTTLLNNCKAVTSNLTSEVVAPEYNRDRVRELAKKYQVPDLGLLVVYGTEPNTSYEFVRRADLFTEETPNMMNPQERPKRIFTGERALINAVSYLAQGKTKITVYFTQGHGETPLDFGRGNAFGQGESLSSLRDALKDRNFEVKPLKLDIGTKNIPDDADVVAIVGAARPFEENVLSALRAYLRGDGGKKKGHLIALLGPAQMEKGPPGAGRVESLLAEYDAQAPPDRVLTAVFKDPLQVDVHADPDTNNALARALFSLQDTPIEYLFRNCRTVSPPPPAMGGNRPYTVETLLIAEPGYGSWAEKNLEGDPVALATEMRENLRVLKERMGTTPLSIAVTVAEGKPAMPPMPGHPPVGGESQPRMVVFGCASWVGSEAVSAAGGRKNVDLFASSLYWLRERPNLGEASSGKTKEEYSLPPQPDGGWRLVLLPGALLLLAVVMLGSGIWVVRRR
jgi:hypothetical protein